LEFIDCAQEKVMKKRKIKEQLASIEKRLANAEEYVAQNVNVEGSSWLHFGDWSGKSGHPSWMKNHMIPTLKKVRARKEKALECIDTKAKERSLSMRRRQRVK
jgi:hypothetical protein